MVEDVKSNLILDDLKDIQGLSRYSKNLDRLYQNLTIDKIKGKLKPKISIYKNESVRVTNPKMLNMHYNKISKKKYTFI